MYKYSFRHYNFDYNTVQFKLLYVYTGSEPRSSHLALINIGFYRNPVFHF